MAQLMARQLIELLEQVPDDTKLEFSDGEKVEHLCFSADKRRAIIGCEPDRPQQLAYGWNYVGETS